MKNPQKYHTYYCTNHDTIWPVGGASIISATNEQAARKKLKRKLKNHGLNENQEFTLTKLKVGETVILCDGDYQKGEGNENSY